MRVFTSREFNQDVTQAKRIARTELVVVTDRGRPTHVLLSIEAYRRMSGQPNNVVDMLATEDAGDRLDSGDFAGAWGRP